MVVLLSPSAARFVGPLSFAALSRHPVETEIMELLPDGRIGHIVIADSVDAIVVAPATAHWLGSMANGLAGDVVTAACLASSAPVVVAPAMDGDMWTHPATQANVAAAPRRVRVSDRGSGQRRARVGPAGCRTPGRAARDRRCGRRGGRRPPGPPARRRGPPAARRGPCPTMRISRGGTWSSPRAARASRSIRSASSATARAGRWGSRSPRRPSTAGRRSRSSRPTSSVALPEDRARIVRVETTGELRGALLDTLFGGPGSPNAARFDALVMAAAVADFTPLRPAGRKLERGEGADARARAHAGSPGRDRPDRPGPRQRRRTDPRAGRARPAPGRLRGRNRQPGARREEAPGQARGSPRGERRRRRPAPGSGRTRTAS